MAGAKGCNDDFASFVIFALNSILLILTILGLVAISYVWVTQSDLEGVGAQALSATIPEFILVIGIVVVVVVMSIAMLGLCATCIQMKANADAEKEDKATFTDEAEDADEDGKPKNKKKGCCHLWGMGVYVFLCVMAFFFLLAVAIVSGVYSDKMTSFNSLDVVREKGDDWMDTFESKVTTQVKQLADKYPITWNNTQAAIGCCGWNLENGNATAFTNSRCCHDSNVVTSVNIIGKVNFDVTGCRKDGDDKVYTCEGIVASYIQSNLVKTSISTAALAFLQLALAICGCVVRYPHLFAYCNCCKKKDEKIAPTDDDTRVQNMNGGDI